MSTRPLTEEFPTKVTVQAAAAVAPTNSFKKLSNGVRTAIGAHPSKVCLARLYLLFWCI